MSNWSSVSESPTRLATAGWLTSQLNAALDAWITANASADPHYILINIGVNDPPAGTSQMIFESNLADVLDKVHAAFPDARIFLAKVWRRNYDAQCDTLNDVWMENVKATRAWVEDGPDERIVIKSFDDGQTYTSDGVHYNSAGDTVWALAWQQATGLI